jgi:alpha-aminoadipic semialdehyde synthase
VFPDEAYRTIGAEVVPSLEGAQVIFAVKEIPVHLIQPEKTYVFFSHTIKGQAYNMPLLQRILDERATLIDYERVMDDQGRRLVFFGVHAGYAGMIDSLHLLGQRRLAQRGHSMFAPLEPAWRYDSLNSAKEAVAAVGHRIIEEGLQDPVLFGFAGYGNVSRGAQEILDCLPVVTLSVDQVASMAQTKGPHHAVYKVVFQEQDLVEPLEGAFELSTYYQHPERFRGVFHRYLPHLNVLMNCIYWTKAYPRLVTRKTLRDQHATTRLEIIGDISIDIEGAIEVSIKSTHSDHPCYVYQPMSDDFVEGIIGEGPTILAVDNLPCELPRESSEHFSQALLPLVTPLKHTQWAVPFDQLDLPAPLKRATIAHRGSLTPDYAYLRDFLK